MNCFDSFYCKPSKGKLKTCFRHKRGPRGFNGATGATGPTGPTGTAASEPANLISFSASVSVLPIDPFALPTSTQMAGNIPTFDVTTSNPFPANFAQTFLVPQNGIVSDLILRIQGRAPETNVTAAEFSATVYRSPATLGSAQSTSGWTLTTLTTSTVSMNIPVGTSMTVTAQNTTASVPVFVGDLVTVVITPSGFSFFDIQPATVNATFFYQPSHFG